MDFLSPLPLEIAFLKIIIIKDYTVMELFEFYVIKHLKSK